MPARITADPFEGARHLALSINGVPNTFTGLFQPLDEIVPGNDYEFSIWAKREGLVSGLLEYRIEWINAQGQFVGSQFSENLRIGHLLNDEYQWFQNRVTAPAGAIKARAVVAAISTSRSLNLRAYIDSASFTAIPEPSSAILLALVGMLLPTRRLRHNAGNTTEDLSYLPE